jgi:hypothetical protein
MYGLTRGTMTLIGAGVAGFLVWLATQFDLASTGEYWAAAGVLAAAGLTMALSQLLGGWTKWGWPRVSGSVFLIAFWPALVVGGWVLLAAMPADDYNTSNFSDDIGIGGVVDALGEQWGVIAFALGLIFGFTFDTTGPRVRRTAAAAPAAGPGPVGGTADRGDEPGRAASERRTPVAAGTAEPEPEAPPRTGGPDGTR